MITNLLLLLYFQFISFINVFTIFPIIYVLSFFRKDIKFFFINFYFIGLVYIILSIYDVKLYVKNKNLIKNIFLNNKKVIIQNHQTEFDFIIILMLLSYSNIKDNIIRFIMTKKIYYFFPGIGLGNILSNGVMISPQNKDYNIKNLENIKISNNESIYIFPEGFICHYENKLKSDTYCKENKIECPKYTLYPKTTGIEIISKNNKIDFLYTLCVHFDGLTPGMKPYRIYNTYITKKIFLEINETNIISKDNIINSFQKIDKSFENRDYKGFELFEKKYVNLIAFLCNIFYFLLIIYLFSKYNFLFKIFLIELFIYYFYIFIL